MKFNLLWLVLLMGLPLNVVAHALAPGLLQLEENENGIAMRWKTARKRGNFPLSPKLPAECRFIGEPAYEINDQASVVTTVLDCGATDSLVGQKIGVNNIERNITSVLLRYQYRDGTSASRLLSNKEPEFVIPVQMGRLAVMQEYFLLGVDHLLFGYDHVVFVLALLLLIRKLRTLVYGITFFTVGHSITLALSIFKIIVLPSALVEIAIAGSIVFLAREIFSRSEQPSSVEHRVWVLPLIFGLLHGLGFASALSQTGVPAHEIPAALLAFNVGIECGQLLIVGLYLLFMPCFRWLQSHLLPGTSLMMQRIAAYGIGGLSAFWVIDRSYQFFV